MEANTESPEKPMPHHPLEQNPRSAHKGPPHHEEPQVPPGRETRMHEKPDHGETSYKGLGRLAGRAALVTGGDSGIGRAVCLAFAREGADVAIAYLDEHDDARETERLVVAAGRKALLLPGDLGNATHCAGVVKKTAVAFGKIDVVINNAAFQGKAADSLASLSPERLEHTFRVNVLAMFNVAREAVPHMSPGGAIVNTASIQAYKPSPAILDYAATKGAIVAFTKGLSRELIEKGIRVNCVAPGPVWTPIIVQSYEGEKLEKFGEQSPMKRPAQPSELAPAYVFLACDESRYVNGEVLGVTGGMLLA
jgi:NAD(P)-dependent dehydrogenase (short-subunit alcohol dehydrogenase family)